MSMENNNSDKPVSSQDPKLNGKLRYARKVNWCPTDKPESYRTVVVNYHFGNVEEVHRNTGAIPKSRESWNHALSAAASENKKTDECPDVPSLGRLFQVSKEKLADDKRDPANESFVPKELVAHGETEMCCMRPSKKKIAESSESSSCQFLSCSVRNQRPNMVKEPKQKPSAEMVCCMRPTKAKMSNPHEEKIKTQTFSATEAVKPPVSKKDAAERDTLQLPADPARPNPERSRNTDVCLPKMKAPKSVSKDIEIRCLPYPFGFNVVTHPDLCSCFCYNRMEPFTDNSNIYPLSQAMRDAHPDRSPKQAMMSEDDIETADTTEDHTEIDSKRFNNGHETESNDNEQIEAASNEKIHQASNIKLIADLLKNRIQSSLATTARNTATPGSVNTTTPPQQKNKSKAATGTSNFKQRQMELHRYRIEVEERRLLLLDTKLRREMDEMMRENLLFTKELELKEAQIQQFKEERESA